MDLDLRMARTRDPNALMRALLLLALTAFLTKLLLRGELSQFIHPKFTWFTASAGLGLLLMAVGQLRRWLRGNTGVINPLRYRLYTAVAAVICTGFLLQPHTFASDLASKQGLNVTNRSSGRSAAQAATAGTGAGQTAAPDQPDQAGTAGQAGTSGQAEPPPTAKPGAEGQAGGEASTPPVPSTTPSEGAPADQTATSPPAAEVADVLTITPQNYVQMMFELYDYPEKYAGKRIVMEGFVFHPPDVEGPNFALVRLVVTCHVAHAYPDGLVAYIPELAERPKQDLWYRLEGQLEPWLYREKTTLKLKVEKATPIEAPADPYVYP